MVIMTSYEELLAEERKKKRLIQQAIGLTQKSNKKIKPADKLILPEKLPDILSPIDKKPTWIADINHTDAAEVKKAQNIQKTKNTINNNLRGQPSQYRKRRRYK